MTNKNTKKIMIVAVFAVLVLLVAGAAFLLNRQSTKAGEKNFQIEVISDRDGFNQTTECTSELEFLGEYLQTMDECMWEESEYGTYVLGFNGMEQDLDNQYWWCVTVNDEQSEYGVDMIPLQEGDKYTFTLTQGW